MKFIVDIDDTILNLVDVWLTIYNHEYDDNVQKSDIKTWDIGSYTKIGKDFYKYLSMPHFSLYNSTRPIQGALETIRYLKSKGHKIRYVTAFDYMNRKYHWLEKYGFMESDQEYIVAADKSSICGDVMIDDKYDNIKHFTGEIKILFDQPWNQEYEFPDRYDSKIGQYRAKNWDQIMILFGGKF